MKPEDNGRRLELKLAACQPLVGAFDVAELHSLAFFHTSFFLHSAFTPLHTYHSTGSVLLPFLKLILYWLETQASCSSEQATCSLHSSRQCLRVQHFSVSGGVSALSPQCALFPLQESRLKGSADLFLPKDEGNTKLTLWLRNDMMPVLLLEPCS